MERNLSFAVHVAAKGPESFALNIELAFGSYLSDSVFVIKSGTGRRQPKQLIITFFSSSFVASVAPRGLRGGTLPTKKLIYIAKDVCKAFHFKITTEVAWCS